MQFAAWTDLDSEEGGRGNPVNIQENRLSLALVQLHVKKHIIPKMKPRGEGKIPLATLI